MCLFGAASLLLAGSSLSSCKQEMFLIKRSLERTLPSPTVNPLMDNHMPLVSLATPTRNRSRMHSKERTIHPLRPMVARPTTLTLNLSTRMFQAVMRGEGKGKGKGKVKGKGRKGKDKGMGRCAPQARRRAGFQGSERSELT